MPKCEATIQVSYKSNPHGMNHMNLYCEAKLNHEGYHYARYAIGFLGQCALWDDNEYVEIDND